MIEFLLALMLMFQIVGLIYFFESDMINRLFRNITIGDIIMVFLAPFTFLLLFVVAFLISIGICIYELISPFWNKRIFK